MTEGKRTLKFRFWVYYAPMLAFLALAIAGMYAIQQASQNDAENLREALVDSCERVNQLREESNERIEKHESERDVIVRALKLSKSVVSDSEVPEIRASVPEYDKLIAELNRLRFGRVIVPNCEATVPHP